MSYKTRVQLRAEMSSGLVPTSLDRPSFISQQNLRAGNDDIEEVDRHKSKAIDT